MMTVKDWVQIGITLLAMIVGPLFAVHLSLRQFHSQKWWERRADSYASLMEKLAVLKYAIRLWYEDAIHSLELSQEKKEDLGAKYRIAVEQLEQSAVAASFLISDGALAAINSMIRALETRGSDWMASIDKDWDAIDACINTLKASAISDLKRG